MNILEIDCVSYATRVGYTAAAELYNLLQAEDSDRETNPARFLPGDVPEALEAQATMAGEYICLKGCETGERLFRWMDGERIHGQTWKTLDQALVLTYETFVQVCSSTYTKLHCRQIEAERRDQVPPAPPPMPIEDTIFEPVGSLGELLPHAVEALNRSAELQAEAQKKIADVTGLNAMSLGETMHSASAGQAPAPDPASGAPQTASGAPSLPPAPKTPAQRKGRASAPKHQK